MKLASTLLMFVAVMAVIAGLSVADDIIRHGLLPLILTPLAFVAGHYCRRGTMLRLRVAYKRLDRRVLGRRSLRPYSPSAGARRR